jgi:short-subunit dehydrogenase
MINLFTHQVIWLTGGSSGIGRELAQQLAQLDNQIYISGRDTTALASLVDAFPQHIIAMAGDITDQATVTDHAKRIQQDHQHIDCLILNAGTAEYVDATHFNSELFERVFAINFFANTRVLSSALPLLRQGESKYIVGISSSAVFAPLSRAQAYGASKAAFSYLLDSLRVDLTAEGFDISIVYPGFVKTPLTDKNDFPMPMRINADAAAAHIVSGLHKRQQQIMFPWLFCTFLKLIGALPSKIRNRLMQKFRKEQA